MIHVEWRVEWQKGRRQVVKKDPKPSQRGKEKRERERALLPPAPTAGQQRRHARSPLSAMLTGRDDRTYKRRRVTAIPIAVHIFMPVMPVAADAIASSLYHRR
jgi:hypothetical protein